VIIENIALLCAVRSTDEHPIASAPLEEYHAPLFPQARSARLANAAVDNQWLRKPPDRHGNQGLYRDEAALNAAKQIAKNVEAFTPSLDIL
jgi:hypothetical protein